MISSRFLRPALAAAAALLVAACSDRAPTAADAPSLAAASPVVRWQKVASLPGAFDLTVAPDGALWAAAADRGVMRSADGFQWTAVAPLADGDEAGAIVALSSGDLYIGTTTGIYLSQDAGSSWIPVGLQDLYITHLAADDRGIVYAAAPGFLGGIYRGERLALGQMHWTRIFEPLGAREAFYDFLTVHRGDVFVGPYSQTPYWGRDGGASFEPIFALWELPDFPAFADDMLETRDGAVLAAYAGGIGRSIDGGQSFQHVYAGLPVWKFTSDERTRSIYALVYEGRVIRSTDDGATWQPFAAAPPMTGISDIAVAADGRLVVSGYEGSWKTVR
jgi:photosystem II stability/assembly factor-like uncharacterized protein